MLSKITSNEINDPTNNNELCASLGLKKFFLFPIVNVNFSGEKTEFLMDLMCH